VKICPFYCENLCLFVHLLWGVVLHQPIFLKWGAKGGKLGVMTTQCPYHSNLSRMIQPTRLVTAMTPPVAVRFHHLAQYFRPHKVVEGIDSANDNASLSSGVRSGAALPPPGMAPPRSCCVFSFLHLCIILSHHLFSIFTQHIASPL